MIQGKNDYWNDMIEEYHYEKRHKRLVMFTEFMLDVCIRVLIVVAIGLLIISIS